MYVSHTHKTTWPSLSLFLFFWFSLSLSPFFLLPLPSLSFFNKPKTEKPNIAKSQKTPKKLELGNINRLSKKSFCWIGWI